MTRLPKTGQLQIRVSRAQKRAIRKRADAAGMTMSEWILSRILPSSRAVFEDRVAALATADQPSYPFAELLDWLASLPATEFEEAVAEPPAARLDRYWQAYLASTIEQAAAAKGARSPDWAREVPPLNEPVFGSSLESLRLHLLANSPPTFARRNIFIDASVGDRV